MATTTKKPEAGKPASGRVTHVVLRIIQGVEGRDIYAGTPEEPVLVDASGWANAALLVQLGHLRPAMYEEVVAHEEALAAKATPGYSIIGAVPPEGVTAAIVLHIVGCECEDSGPEGWGVIEPFQAKTLKEASEVVAQLGPEAEITIAECLAEVPEDEAAAEELAAANAKAEEKTEVVRLKKLAKEGTAAEKKEAKAELKRRADAVKAAKAAK
jgi:hypothetical protein